MESFAMSEQSSSEFSKSSIEALAEALANFETQANRLILIGTSDWVKGVIYQLHRAHIADMSAWTRLMPTQNPDEVISLLQRRRPTES